ncbi:MAG: hypothetical protein IPJ34_42390 [Myxococcales bacterium]|nr:hypothetical protein [Myxococcales bacterium]
MQALLGLEPQRARRVVHDERAQGLDLGAAPPERAQGERAELGLDRRGAPPRTTSS